MQSVTQAAMNTKATSSEFAADLQGWLKHLEDHGNRLVAILPPVEINSQGVGIYFLIAEPVK